MSYFVYIIFKKISNKIEFKAVNKKTFYFYHGSNNYFKIESLNEFQTKI